MTIESSSSYRSVRFKVNVNFAGEILRAIMPRARTLRERYCWYLSRQPFNGVTISLRLTHIAGTTRKL